VRINCFRFDLRNLGIVYGRSAYFSGPAARHRAADTGPANDASGNDGFGCLLGRRIGERVEAVQYGFGGIESAIGPEDRAARF
jgi:hypothetical protein